MDIKILFSSGIISVIISIVANYFFNKKNEKYSLDNTLNMILKISIEYPYLENENFIIEWSNNHNKEKYNEKYMRYEVYYTLVFNFFERVCIYYNYNQKIIYKYINLKECVRLHRLAWEGDLYNNIDSYSEKLKK